MFTRNDTLFSYTTRFRAGARLRRPEVERRIHTRLGRLSTWLGEKDYLEGRFTVGDLMMAAVLRELRHTDFLAAHANLAAYQARCEGRPAFRRALEAQLAVFEKRAPEAAARKSAVSGQRSSVRGDLGCRRSIKKKNNKITIIIN